MTISIKPTASGSTIEQDGSTILTVDSSGNLSVPNTLTSTGAITGTGGIYLGGTASANLLDDYEEGTWTPEIGATVTNPTSVTQNNAGYYIKNGGIVNVWGHIGLTLLSGGSGQLTIENLPFTCKTWTTITAINGSGHVVYWTGIPSTKTNITCWAFRGSTQARFNAISSAVGTSQPFNITDLDGSCDFRFYISYPSDN